MIQQYRFSINGHSVNAIYSDDISSDYTLQQDQKFLRQSLQSKIDLVKDDYDWLKAQPISTQFVLLIERLINDVWETFFTGKFTKVDCEWDDDNKKVELKPTPQDKYDSILNILDKETNLVDLAPVIEKMNYYKRPIVQVYAKGGRTVSCYQSGVYWEEEVVEPIDSTTRLTTEFFFASCANLYEANASGTCTPDVTGGYVGVETNAVGAQSIYKTTIYESGGTYTYSIIRISDNELMFEGTTTEPLGTLAYLTAVSPEASGYVEIWGRYVNLYKRIVMSATTYNGTPTSAIPYSDIIEYNRNYPRCIPSSVNIFESTPECSVETTKYGRNDISKYFVPPPIAFDSFYPVSKNSWVNVSYWLNMTALSATNYDTLGRSLHVLNDAYPIYSVISALLEKFAPDIYFGNTPEFSEFLFSELNPISFQSFELLMTQKTNIFNTSYDRPAQKAPITLGSILDMLNGIYQCYWHLEGKNLRIEHTSWYSNGGTYVGTQAIGVDLTIGQDSHNKKELDFGQSKFSYDKSAIPSRLEFSWMDTVTLSFEGFPIDILSTYAKQGNTKKIQIQKFTTDIDYVIANYNKVSQDGFMLFSCIQNELPNPIKYILPFVERTIDNSNVPMQNGYLSWITLHPTYYRHDMPGLIVSINGLNVAAISVQKIKIQVVSFPSNGFDMTKLIKTSLGNGFIEKISLNLSSLIAKVTLKHETEQ